MSINSASFRYVASKFFSNSLKVEAPQKQIKITGATLGTFEVSHVNITGHYKYNFHVNV